MKPIDSSDAFGATTRITSFPEELLEQILGLCVSDPPLVPLIRPSWHAQHRSLSSSSQTRSQLAALLVCKSWLRIAMPLLYSSIHLVNERQAFLLSWTLAQYPQLGKCVLHLSIMHISRALPAIIKLCPAVQSLDLTLELDSEIRTHYVFPSLQGVAVWDIRKFSLRKLPGVYLTQTNVRLFVSVLSMLVIPRWKNLVSE